MRKKQSGLIFFGVGSAIIGFSFNVLWALFAAGVILAFIGGFLLLSEKE